jgi:tRNA A37 threonylcarbamoyladenosine synthetase subunit TsaC/SUA5/YrdC
MLLTELGEPVMSSTLLLPGEELPRTDAKEIYELLEQKVDLVLDGGNCGLVPTSVIDLSAGTRRWSAWGAAMSPLLRRGPRIMRAQCGRNSSCFL